MALWKRYQYEIGILFKIFVGTSLRSSNTTPKPPACSSKSTDFIVYSGLHLQRTQSSLSSWTPQAKAESGWKLLLKSTTAQNSPFCVARAKTCMQSELFPEERGPLASTREPLFKPLIRKPLKAWMRREGEAMSDAICGRSMALFQRGSEGRADDRFAICSP